MMKVKENLIRYPDETWDPLTYLEEAKRQELFELIQRNEDNNEHDIENIYIKTGCVNEAKGSCYIEIGQTKVICTLYGPREIVKKDDFNFKVAKLNCQFRYTSFSTLNFQRRTGGFFFMSINKL
jgi:exosome complex component MTR3